LAADFGLSTPAFPVADTDRAMAAGAGRVTALVDHTKVGLRSSVLTVPTEQIQQLITDSKSSEESELTALREAGVEVEVA
jgi:DeoR/GlpR family transcriptional regulator of sugar metabolism